MRSRPAAVYKAAAAAAAGPGAGAGAAMAAVRCLLLLLCSAALGRAVHLDFAEHRSQAAKIKVNPRGNLWATGTGVGGRRLRPSGPRRGSGLRGGRRARGQGEAAASAPLSGAGPAAR